MDLEKIPVWNKEKAAKTLTQQCWVTENSVRVALDSQVWEIVKTRKSPHKLDEK